MRPQRSAQSPSLCRSGSRSQAVLPPCARAPGLVRCVPHRLAVAPPALLALPPPSLLARPAPALLALPPPSLLARPAPALLALPPPAPLALPPPSLLALPPLALLALPPLGPLGQSLSLMAQMGPRRFRIDLWPLAMDHSLCRGCDPWRPSHSTRPASPQSRRRRKCRSLRRSRQEEAGRLSRRAVSSSPQPFRVFCIETRG
jgi:hypothetical protein